MHFGWTLDGPSPDPPCTRSPAPGIRCRTTGAAASIGGFKQDFVSGVNDTIFNAYGTEDKIAELRKAA